MAVIGLNQTGGYKWRRKRDDSGEISVPLELSKFQHLPVAFSVDLACCRVSYILITSPFACHCKTVTAIRYASGAPRPSLASWPLGIIGRHPKKIGTKGAHENHFDLLTLHTKKLQKMRPIILIFFGRHRPSRSLAPLTENTLNGAFR